MNDPSRISGEQDRQIEPLLQSLVAGHRDRAFLPELSGAKDRIGVVGVYVVVPGRLIEKVLNLEAPTRTFLQRVCASNQELIAVVSRHGVGIEIPLEAYLRQVRCNL